MTAMTTKDFATALGTDPRTARKYLRDSTPREEHPGKGGRWELKGDKRTIAKHLTTFKTWQAEQAKKAAERAAKAQADAEAALEDAPEVDEDSTDDEVDSDEETDES